MNPKKKKEKKKKKKKKGRRKSNGLLKPVYGLSILLVVAKRLLRISIGFSGDFLLPRFGSSLVHVLRSQNLGKKNWEKGRATNWAPRGYLERWRSPD